MIQITSRRFGPIVVAATANDNRDISFAIGLTHTAARSRLCWAVA